MIKLNFKGMAQLANRVSRNLDSVIAEGSRERVSRLVTSLSLATPKDTGYAASRWTYKSTPNPPFVSYKIQYGGFFTIFKDVEYTVSNDTPYIIYLNRGHSQQAPAYFIERTILNSGYKITGTFLKE